MTVSIRDILSLCRTLLHSSLSREHFLWNTLVQSAERLRLRCEVEERKALPSVGGGGGGVHRGGRNVAPGHR